MSLLKLHYSPEKHIGDNSCKLWQKHKHFSGCVSLFLAKIFVLFPGYVECSRTLTHTHTHTQESSLCSLQKKNENHCVEPWHESLGFFYFGRKSILWHSTSHVTNGAEDSSSTEEVSCIECRMKQLQLFILMMLLRQPCLYRCVLLYFYICVYVRWTVSRWWMKIYFSIWHILWSHSLSHRLLSLCVFFFVNEMDICGNWLIKLLQFLDITLVNYLIFQFISLFFFFFFFSSSAFFCDVWWI
jgi:hypothetical protein